MPLPKTLDVLVQSAAAAAVVLVTGVCNSLMSPVTADASERHRHLLEPVPDAGSWTGELSTNVRG